MTNAIQTCQHPADNSSSTELLLVCPDCGARCSDTQIGDDQLCYDAACPLHVMAGAAETYVASLSTALTWAASAAAGDYLVEYEDTGMTDRDDPGSRCGYDDRGLDEIRRVLERRELTLTADDRGLVARSVRS